MLSASDVAATALTKYGMTSRDAMTKYGRLVKYQRTCNDDLVMIHPRDV